MQHDRAAHGTLRAHTMHALDASRAPRRIWPLSGRLPVLWRISRRCSTPWRHAPLGSVYDRCNHRAFNSKRCACTGRCAQSRAAQEAIRLGAPYSAQEVSYRKLLGQLDERGNAATIAHYLELLAQTGIMPSILKYDPKLLQSRSSSPRLLVHDTALMTAAYGPSRSRLLEDPDLKGHLVESAVGACLIARSQTESFELNWWRDGSDEVDFVASNARQTLAIEVKSGRAKSTHGLTAFVLRYPEARTLVVGPECSAAWHSASPRSSRRSP